MTDKKPLSSKPSNQLALTSVETLNRFQVLGRIPQPYSYTSALVNPPPMEDPFSSSQVTNIPSSRPITQFQTYNKPQSVYIPKSNQHKLFHIEPTLSNSNNPVDFAKAYFPPGWQFVPSHPDKSIRFYKAVLEHHKSIHIKPITDKNDKTKIIYHSLHIHKVITYAEWDNHPWTVRATTDFPLPHNYHDYIDAWFKLFLYQNDTFTHSWFIGWNNTFQPQVPAWFLKWWDYFGATPDILPDDLNDQVTIFSSQFKVNKANSYFPNLFHFMAKYKVPWIFKWQYTINDNTVIRQHFVKWWPSYQHQRIIDAVKKEFPVRIPTPISNVQQEFPVRVPPAPASQVPVVTSTATPSSSKPSSSKKKTSKSKSSNSRELIKMAQLLMAQAQQSDEEDGSDQDSNESTSATYHLSQFQDAQDPFT